MRRFATLALLATALIAFAIHTTANADLENQGTDAPKLFTSKADRLRLVVPRGWRATDQPSYPGLLLWMLHARPDGRIVLTAEAFTRELYCSWPVSCRTSHETLPRKFACALQKKLQAVRMRVAEQSIQAGPKENEEAGMPSVWFEYDDGRHYFRQAVALTEERVVSLVLSANSIDARSQHVRAFEQVLRTLRPLTGEELGATIAASLDAGVVISAPSDAQPADAAMLADASIGAAVGSASFESAPAPKINPVGTCTKQ